MPKLLSLIILNIFVFFQVYALKLPPKITKEELAKNNKLFIELEAKVLYWDRSGQDRWAAIFCRNTGA